MPDPTQGDREPVEPVPSRPGMFEALVEHAVDYVSVTDGTGRTLYANAAARAVFGDPDATDGLRFVHPDDLDAVVAANVRLRERAGATERLQCRLRAPDGGWLTVDVVAVNLLHDPAVRGVLYLSRDVTERVRAERERDRQLAGQRLVADLGIRSLTGVPYEVLVREALLGLQEVLGVDLVHLLDMEGGGARVRDAVGTGTLTVGEVLDSVVVAESAVGVSLRQRGPVVVRDVAAEVASVPPAVLLERGVVSSLVVLLEGAPGPTGVLCAHTLVPRDFSGGDLSVAQAVANVLAGAAVAAEREAETRHLALHDPLTGLANRVLLEDRLEQALQRAARDGAHVALLFLDLDGFKGVNDAHGHAGGDAVLTVLASRLLAVFRSADTVARLGGDEFVVVCTDLHGDVEAEGLLERVTELWHEPVVLPGGAQPGACRVRLSGSVGVAVARGGEVAARELIARADEAMYRRKARRGAPGPPLVG